MAVNEMAISMGKNSANTGISNVPKPKPEKKVRSEPKKQTNPIITMLSVKVYFAFTIY